MFNHRLILLLLLLSAGSLYGQDSISVDAVSAMHVCSEKYPASAGPCATAPRLANKVSPSYPETARQKKREGTVTLAMIVSRDGSVSAVHVVTGVDADIDRAAVEAVNQWKFDPGTYEGKPVDVELSATVNFRLSSTPLPPAAAENLQAQTKAADDSRNMYSDALEAYNRGDYATSVNMFRKITTITRDNSSAWNELGRGLLAMNQLDAAADAFQTSITKDQASRNAYNNLGLVYWRERKYDDAATQFRKQMVVNPDDHYAHRNLGMMLRDQHRCSEAMPELQKALSLTPNHAETLLAEGECDLDLGNKAKGISELEQATGVSSAPSIFNGAAYALAKRNIEMGKAEKLSETCLGMEKIRMQNISLDVLTPEKLNYVFWIAAYWDTRGWIYFLNGDDKNAVSYLEAAWSFRADPTVGDHLGQIYEKSGRPDDAARIYAMAIASADLPTRAKIDLDDLADAKQRLAKLSGGNSNATLERGRVNLAARNVVALKNAGAVTATGDFAVKLSPAGKTAEFRQVNGDKALEKFVAPLQALKLPVSLPDSAGVEVPLRGTLTCRSEEPECRFGLLIPEEAVNLVRTEIALASSMPGTGRDPHVYDDAALGMRISLPDEWQMISQERASFGHPRNVMFGKSGSPGMFMLTHERFEGSTELYLKMIENFFSKRKDFKRSGEQTVKRDGLTGTRWNVSWNENGIVFSAVMEMFSIGDDYYRITTLAPNEIYPRYAETFENVLRSVQFPMLKADPRLLDSLK